MALLGLGVEQPDQWPVRPAARIDAQPGEPLGGHVFELGDRQIGNPLHQVRRHFERVQQVAAAVLQHLGIAGQVFTTAAVEVGDSGLLHGGAIVAGGVCGQGYGVHAVTTSISSWSSRSG
ncbi:hypothetical protein D3C77_648990 [compost metagenome]